MEQLTKKKEIVSIFLKNGVLVGKNVLEKLNQPNVVDTWHSALSKGVRPQDLLNPPSSVSSVRIVQEYDDRPKKRCIQDFVDYFNARYRSLEKMLKHRSELQNLTSIGRLRGKKDREKVSIIGIVADKHETKNNHIMVTLEDTTGSIKVLFSKNKTDVLDLAKDIVCDEVIGICGTLGEDIVFANSLIVPDIPIAEMKKAPDEAYLAVLTCIHIGSSLFEAEKFERFIQWCNGEYGSPEERNMAKKLKYIFVAGDIVDGVGIYPRHESELEIKEIREQYAEAARLLSRLPENLSIVVCPGNHDAGRISEPQPKLPQEYAHKLWALPNVTMVCNPCLLNIHQSNHFSGFNVLLYHGYSFDDYGEIVPSIKNSGAHISDRIVLIMRFLLRRRHLAPQHTSTLYIPDPRMDPLVIEQVPDLFLAGHIHKAGALNYRGVSLVAGSCFQSKTSFQEKVGHEPEPGVVPIINLQTREITMVRF